MTQIHLRTCLVLAITAWAAGCETVPDLGYTATLPAGYTSQRAVGLSEPLTGESAVGSRNADDSFSATISVFVEPDVVHGGLWQDENAQADHELFILQSPGAGGFDDGFVLVDDSTVRLDGATARSLTFELNLWVPHVPDSKLPIRVRQRVVYAKHDTDVYRVSLLADAAEFANQEPGFDAFLASFEFD